VADLIRFQKEAEANASTTMCNGESFHFDVSFGRFLQLFRANAVRNRAAATCNLYTLPSVQPRSPAKRTPHATDYSLPVLNQVSAPPAP